MWALHLQRTAAGTVAAGVCRVDGETVLRWPDSPPYAGSDAVVTVVTPHPTPTGTPASAVRALSASNGGGGCQVSPTGGSPPVDALLLPILLLLIRIARACLVQVTELCRGRRALSNSARV